MRVTRTSVESIEGATDRVRLHADVRYDRGRPDTEDLWIEVPADLRDGLDDGGNAWLAALLPLAATLGEPLELDVPVDRPVLVGAREVLRAWRCWYGGPRVVEVHAPERPRAAAPPPRRTLACFSGGVDAFFTALGGRDGEAEAARGAVDDLLFLAGFELRLESVGAVARARANAEAAVAATGRRYVSAATNLRSTRWDEVDWALLGHGPLLAGVALALGRRYDLALLPGSVWLGDLVPWASHPLTDGWFSSWDLRIRQDGNETDRFDKVAAIAASDVVRAHLRVCYRSPEGANCGACAKCLLTMAMLDAVGVLAACPTFPARDGYLERLRATEARFPSDRRHLGRVRDAARAAGRDALAEVVDAVLAKRAGGAQLVLGRPGAWSRRLRTWLRRGGART